jgi:hypothetical protein
MTQSYARFVILSLRDQGVADRKAATGQDIMAVVKEIVEFVNLQWTAAPWR